MFFCYVDESGDCGAYDSSKPDRTGTSYFILAGIIVAAAKWRSSLEMMKNHRKVIARDGFLPNHVEFHCAEMIDPHKTKEYTSLSVADRWRMIDEYADMIGRGQTFRVITVVVDKRTSDLSPGAYLEIAVTRLYQAYEEFLKVEDAQGILFFDRANEKHINSHVRKLMGTGASGETMPDVRIGRVLENPIFRVSADSMYVQAADVIAYTLKEREFPQASRKKFNADRIFMKRIQSIVFKSRLADEDGVIRA